MMFYRSQYGRHLPLLSSVNETTAATSQPVTLTEAKEHLGIVISDTTHDRRLKRLLTTATELVQARLSRTLFTTTWTANYRDFPRSEWWIEIPYPPLASVTSVKYYDETGTQQTWSSAEYIVDTTSEPGRVALDPDFSWPTTEVDRINRVEIIYVAGHSTVAAIPHVEKEAVLHWLNRLFEDRGGETDLRFGNQVTQAIEAAAGWGNYS